MGIDRRNFLKLGTGAAAGAFLLANGLHPRRLRAATAMTGVTYLPPSYIGLSFGSNGFVEFLRENAAGVIDVDFHDSGELLKADEQLPALRAGSIDFMFHTSSYVTRSLPILGITGLPGVVGELYRHPERLRIGSPLFELINRELGEKHDLYMLSSGGGILEPEYVWGGKDSPIRSLDDLRGKRTRVVGFEATMALEAYGVAAVRIPSSETYMALQRGTVDAGVFNISTVIGRSLQEQIGYCYKLPTTAFTVAPFMLRSRWDALDDEMKGHLQRAAEWFDENAVHQCNEVIYPDDYWPKVEEAGVEIIEPTEEDIASFGDQTEAVWDRWLEEVGRDVGERAIEYALGRA